jgi:CheY-like chemotaxis protein
MSSKELAQNHELSSGGGGQADNQLSSISSRISRILSSASLEALSSKLSLSPEAAVPMEKQQQQQQQQQTQQYSPDGLSLTPAALSILDGLEILLLSESSTQCKMLCQHLRPINTSWTLRSTTTYEELVGELEVAGFRCDLLLIDSSSLWVASSEKGGADVLTALQQKYPRFMTTVLTVILSEGMSSNSREEEAVRRGVDDCWSKPPEPPVVLQTRLIQAAIVKFLTLSTSSRADSETDSSAVLTNASESDSALSDVVAQLQPRPLNDEQGPNCSDEFFWPADLLEIPANAPPRQQNKKKRMRPKKSLGGDSFSESFKYSGRALSTVGRLLHRGLSNKWSKLSSTEMPLTILVVEDSISQRKLIVRMLQGISANWDVVGCEDDKSAFLELEARNFKVDLIFVDLHLGENSADGNELARSLRKRLSSSAVIIGMNRDRQNTERSFLANGADAAWAKPLPSCDSIGSRLDSLILARTGFAAINEVGGILTDSSSLDSLESALSAQLKSR